MTIPRDALRGVLLAVGIPLVLLVVLGGFVLVPRLLVTPPSSALAYQCSDYRADGRYTVQGDKLVFQENRWDTGSPRPMSLVKPQVYRVDVAAGTTTLVEEGALSALTLTGSRTAPDGAEFGENAGNDSLMTELVTGGSRRGLTVHKGPATYAIRSDACNWYDSDFLGWILSPTL